jgi:NAD(P)-dependent dehydrogenase (short-subunit alcohol dehydrogenase family)
LDETVNAIEAAGGRALAVTADVSRRPDAAAAVAAVAEAFGGLHLLINNAGIARNGALAAMSPEDIDAVIDIDLKGPIHITAAAWPHLQKYREQGGSAVINISSSVTVSPVPNFSVYSAAKAGLEMLTRCWALDGAADRIRVNAIAPGVVETPILATFMPAETVGRALRQIAQATPLGRVGQPADIAALTLFLASPAAAWLTGAIIPLDGGLSLGSAT